MPDVLKQYECGAAYDQHLVLGSVVPPASANRRQQFEALARSVRDLLAARWLKTQEAHERANPKRVYYLSMEFLIGRSLASNVTNLQAEPIVRAAMETRGLD